jgi:hypothetical protein
MALAILSFTTRELTQESSTDNVINTFTSWSHYKYPHLPPPLFLLLPHHFHCSELVPSEIVFQLSVVEVDLLTLRNSSNLLGQFIRPYNSSYSLSLFSSALLALKSAVVFHIFLFSLIFYPTGWNRK